MAILFGHGKHWFGVLEGAKVYFDVLTPLNGGVRVRKADGENERGMKEMALKVVEETFGVGEGSEDGG